MAVEITPDYLARSGTEDGHQSALFMHATDPRYAAGRDPLWALLYAIPNGGARSGATAARMKATGAKKGFPDVGLPVARGGFHALFIEVKRPKAEGKRAGVVGDDQSKWHIALHNEGNCVGICYGWTHARLMIEAYLAGAIQRFACPTA